MEENTFLHRIPYHREIKDVLFVIDSFKALDPLDGILSFIYKKY